MPAPNYAQVIEALEKALHGTQRLFVYAFYEAYGTPQATMRLIKIGHHNIAKIPGDVGVAQRQNFCASPLAAPSMRLSMKSGEQS